jgi:hypothetical protein
VIGKNINTIIILLIVSTILFATFSSTSFTVEPTEPQVYMVHKSWWGLDKSYTPIRWLKTSGYDFPCWMAQGRDGSWYCAVYEP